MPNPKNVRGAKPIQMDVLAGTPAFKTVTAGYDVQDMWLPVQDRYFKKIKRTLAYPLKYPELFEKAFPDVRPYLITLLHQGNISIDTFSCLHILAQMKDSGYKNISASRLAENSNRLQLDHQKIKILKEKATDEDVVFKISLEDNVVVTHFIHILQAIKFEMAISNYASAYRKYTKNKYLVDQFKDFSDLFKNYVFQDLEDFFERRESQSKFDDLYMITKIDFFVNFMYKKFNISVIEQSYSALVETIFFNGNSPLMTYHYEVNKGWFFIFLPQATLEKYIEVKTTQAVGVSMEWVYRNPVEPTEMKQAKLRHARLGSLVPFGTSGARLVHDMLMPDSATNTLHDIYHFLIVAQMQKELVEITNYWLVLLEKETGAALSYYSWRITDSEIPSCFRFHGLKSELTKIFNKILARFFEEDVLASHEGCLLVMDMIVNQNNAPWKNININDFIPDILKDKALVEFVKEYYQQTQSLSKTAVAFYLKQKNITPIFNDVTWKKDHKLHKNAMSLYVGDTSLRILMSEFEARATKPSTALNLRQWNGKSPVQIKPVKISVCKPIIFRPLFNGH